MHKVATPPPIHPGTKVRCGSHELEFGRHIVELSDGRGLPGDAAALRQRLAAEGYLLLRQFFAPEAILRARHEVLAALDGRGFLNSDLPIDKGGINDDNCALIFPQPEVTEMDRLQQLVLASALADLLGTLLGAPAAPAPRQLVRAVPRGAATACHCDALYVPGSAPMLNVWIPLGETPLEKGPALLCLGSPQFAPIRALREQGHATAEESRRWHGADVIQAALDQGGRWATAVFQPGDILIFGMDMLHGSLPNTTHFYRLSVETRYQVQGTPPPESRGDHEF